MKRSTILSLVVGINCLASACADGGGAGPGVAIGGDDASTSPSTSSDGSAGFIATLPDASTPVTDAWKYVVPQANDNCGTHCYVDPTLPANSHSAFAVGSGAAPTLVYPLANSMHPINVGEMEFQWQGTSSTVYRIELQTTRGAPWVFYVPCTPIDAPDHCGYQMPSGSWQALANANAGATATITVTGAGASTSPPVSIRFSPEPVFGGLYYWSTGIRGTYRKLFGASGKAAPFIYPNMDGTASKTNPTTCGGCHALSRKGDMIAFTAGDIADKGYVRVTPAADPTTPLFQPSGKHDSSLVTLDPTGTWMLVSYQKELDVSPYVLELREVRTNKVLGTVPKELLAPMGAGFFPEWSPDGKSIVLTLAGDIVKQWSVKNGAIAVLPIDPTGSPMFGAAKTLAKNSGETYFYPTWSPDGKWIAFAAAKANQATYDLASARLCLISASGGDIIELANATAGLNKTSTWPKFAPFVQGAQKNVMFITFNSKIDYGFELQNSVLGATDPSRQRPQLWFAGIDVANIKQDPSFAPIWLPFQDTSQNNHLGYWAEELFCDSSANSCGEGAACGAAQRCTVIY